MLTNMKFENRPVHLFNINGRKYTVVRSKLQDWGGAFCPLSSKSIAVVSPKSMSYQQAAMKAAQWMAQRKEPRPSANEEFEVLPL